MTNDAPGRIAHMHLVLFDILEKGARDQCAIELAKENAKAADYPKTGIKPLIRKKAKDIIEIKSILTSWRESLRSHINQQKI